MVPFTMRQKKIKILEAEKKNSRSGLERKTKTDENDLRLNLTKIPTWGLQGKSYVKLVFIQIRTNSQDRKNITWIDDYQ